MKVPFVDLKPIHVELKQKLDSAYNRVLYKNSMFVRGKEDDYFEKEYADFCGAKYCVGVASGLDAIYLILKALDIKEGDEVIIPSNTFIATALAVSYTGAKPILVEPDINTYNIEPNRIEEKITNKTKCIIPVHLQGRPANLDAIKKIARKHKLIVVDDAAQAHGSKYKGKRIGSLCDATAWSFYPGKNLGALGDGGCVTTNSKIIAEKIRILGNYGSDYKYHHIIKGTNSRLDELQAAFLRAKLPYLDRWNNERRRVANRYLNEIKNPLITMPLPCSTEYEHIYHVFAVRCKYRDELEEYLNGKGIETVKHYPIPIHLQKAYSDLCLKRESYPIAEEISRTILSIPIFYGMKEKQISYVIRSINAFKKK